MVNATRCTLVSLLFTPFLAPAGQAPPPRWTLGEPIARYGGMTERGPMLAGVQQVAIGRDQAVYIGDATGVLRLFEPDGRLTRSFGGSGQRSGEFVLLSSIGWLGDTLWVIDEALRRATFFEPVGRLLTSARVTVPGTSGASPSAVPFALLTNGSAAALMRPTPGTAVSARPRASIVRSSRRGIPIDTFASVAVDETVIQGRDRVARPLPQPFSDAALVAATPDGSGIIVVERPAATIAGVAHYHVTRYAADGPVVFSTEHAYTAVPLPRPTVDSVVSELVARQARGFGGPRAADTVVRAVLNTPAFVPPVAGILVGRDGSIWLAHREPDSRPVIAPTYDVLDPTGRRVATLSLSRPGRIVAADLTTVWVAETGDRDATVVVRYPVTKP
jgi:hypothetical protein